MIATHDEISKPYFAPFLDVEKTVLRESEENFTNGQKADHVSHVSLSRGMSSTSTFDGLAKAVESIKQIQEKMERSMKEMIGLFKTMEEKMNNKFEELHVNLNNIVEEIKMKQPTSSGAQKITEYMVSMIFKL